MWLDLDIKEKEKYKKLILAYASLSEAFAQKEDHASISADKVILPKISSKYQEAAFQEAFKAAAEDIGNTSFDASICTKNKKYLVGIKTFGYKANEQKIAQFKKNHNTWNELIRKIEKVKDNDSLSIDDINTVNHKLYLELATMISELRNQRIKSSIANIQGFKVDPSKDYIEYVYHVLMPAIMDNKPVIHVGETDYNQIDIPNIKIIGCTSKKLPSNFMFTDGRHFYKFTPADSQLYMNFDNQNIVKESWNVIYEQNAFQFFLELSDKLFKGMEDIPVPPPADPLQQLIDNGTITDTYSWLIAPKGEVELKSGFNSFYGTGMKLADSQRLNRINKIINDHKQNVAPYHLDPLMEKLKKYSNKNDKSNKFLLRDEICALLETIGNNELSSEVKSFVFRPLNEMYIPIPNARSFHLKNPDFFGKDIGTFKADDPSKLALDKEQRKFILIFEPSGDALQAYITQDNGKAIESTQKQTRLGKWLRNGVFQLGEYEPLTVKKLNELGINAIRLYKTNKKYFNDSKEFTGEEVHIEFIWIDEDSIPCDFLGKITV